MPAADRRGCRSRGHAVKFQSWTESSLIAKEEYDRNPEYSDKKKHFGSLREMVRAYQLTAEQHREAHAHCRTRGIAFCSSAFSESEVDLLDGLDVPFIKIASMDVVNLPLLRYAARKQRPVVISTGMATLGGDRAGGRDGPRPKGTSRSCCCTACRSIPPSTTPSTCATCEMLGQAFDVPVGFSDHTLGTSIPLAAIALGACVIEKHFTLDKDMPGWDHAISADPAELRTIVEEGRNVFAALGGHRRIVTRGGDGEAAQVQAEPGRRDALSPRPRACGGGP